MAEKSSRIRPVIIVVFLMTIIIAIALFMVLKNVSDDSFYSQFFSEAETRIKLITGAVEQRIKDLQLLEAFYMSSNEVTYEEFRSFAMPMSHEPGVKCVFNLKQAQGGRYILDGIVSNDRSEETALRQLMHTGVYMENIKKAENSGLVSIVPVESGGDFLIIKINKKNKSGMIVLGMLVNAETMAHLIMSDIPKKNLHVSFYVFEGNLKKQVFYINPRTPDENNLFLLLYPLLYPPVKDYLREVLLGDKRFLVSVHPGSLFIVRHYQLLHIILSFLGAVIGVLMAFYINATIDKKEEAESYAGEKARQLGKKTDELDRFFSLAIDLLCIAGTDGTFRRLNPAWENILGYKVDSLIGRKFLDFVHPDDQSATIHAMLQLQEGKLVIDFTNRYRHKDGTYKYIEWRSAPYEKEFIYAAARDITGKIETESRLKQSEEMFRHIVQNLPAVISIVNKDGVFTLSEGKGLEVLGLKPGEVVGMNVYEYYKPIPEIGEAIRQSLSGDQNYRQVSVFGAVFETYFLPLFDETGKVTGSLNIASDITSRIKQQKELEELVATLENKNAELERFVYTVSHDLKNPLITIKGFGGVAEKRIKEGKIEETLEAISLVQSAANTMNELINDLLKIARLGKMELVKEDFEIKDAFDDALAVISGEAEKSGAEIFFKDARTDKKPVHADRKRIVEALQNILANAIKFVPAGKKPVIIFECDDKDGEVICSISDNGVGIERKYLTRIFNLFERVSNEVEGTGVGLAIVKRIIEMHGGRVWAESEGEGQGAVFKFILDPAENSSRRY